MSEEGVGYGGAEREIVATHIEVGKDHATAIRKLTDWINNNADLTSDDIFGVTCVSTHVAGDAVDVYIATVWYNVTPVPGH
jgi:hypothetical protein